MTHRSDTPGCEHTRRIDCPRCGSTGCVERCLGDVGHDGDCKFPHYPLHGIDEAVQDMIDEAVQEAVENERRRVLRIIKEAADAPRSPTATAKTMLAKIQAAVLFGWASLEGKDG
jgi:hypothetical protein